MKKIISIFIITVLLFLITSCKVKKEKYTDYTFDFFDTVTTIIGFEKDKNTFDDNCDKIKKWLMEYHKLYDIYTEYDDITNLYTLNNSQGKEIKVDHEIINLLEYSKELYNKTNGKFNIAMGSVLSIWHNYRNTGINNPEKASLPLKSHLESASQHTDINDIVINKNESTVLINDFDLRIDVGGVAKGYAAEQVAQKMSKDGIDGYILNIGGNVKIVGQEYNKEKWTVGIENPDRSSSQDYIEVLALADISLVTSGSYQRFYTVDGKNYHHIIDPSTLYPAEYYSSVSVLCKDSGLADVLSTTLFCLPYNTGIKILECFENVEAMWVTKSGEKLYSNSFKNYIKNS